MLGGGMVTIDIYQHSSKVTSLRWLAVTIVFVALGMPIVMAFNVELNQENNLLRNW